MRGSRAWQLLLLANALDVSAIKLFASPGDLPEAVPRSCAAALAVNITCSPNLITGYAAANGDYLIDQWPNVYCTTACSSSIQTFRANVVSRCGAERYVLYPNSTQKQSPQGLAVGLSWAYSLVCLKDEAGYCLADFYNDKKADCSDCALQYGAVMLSTDFGRVRYSEPAFKSILASCKAPASKYPWTYTSTGSTRPPTSSTTSGATIKPTCTGTWYTSKAGDTCLSISKANSVGTDRMIDLNNLDYECKELTAGRNLCIQDKCTTVVVQKNQTCDSLVQGMAYSVVQLQSWNPSLAGMCDAQFIKNLDPLAGRSICVSPPGGGAVPTISQPTTTRQRPTLESPIFTEWVTATPDVLPPGNSTWPGHATSLGDNTFVIPNITKTVPSQSQQSRDAAARKYCWITEEDYDNSYDPWSAPGGCQALWSTYCEPLPTMPLPTASPRIPLACTPDRSHYNDTIPTAVPTPVPAQPGMTKGCVKFHMVKDKETCQPIATQYGISLQDFYAWNTKVGSNCQGLQANAYACVGFDPRLVPDDEGPRPMRVAGGEDEAGLGPVATDTSSTAGDMASSTSASSKSSSEPSTAGAPTSSSASVRPGSSGTGSGAVASTSIVRVSAGASSTL